MNELAELIEQQKKDRYNYKIYDKAENMTLIRPHVFRFDCFAGDNLKQKAFSILKYFGWKNKEIIQALDLTALELAKMQTILNTTVNKKFYSIFYKKIPADTPRNKAILILRGLKWKEQDIANMFQISRRQVNRLTKIIRNNP